MIEAISEVDDELAEKYILGEELTEAEIKAGIRKATIGLKIFPVICGSAFKNKGVQTMLDAVVDYLPSPLDIPPIEGTSIDDAEIKMVRAFFGFRAVLGAGVQDHDRPVCRPAGLFPRLFGKDVGRRVGVQCGQGPQRARRPLAAHARQ